MKVNDIILSMRSRLNDTVPANYRWSDEELMDMINSSLSNLSRELFLFTHQEMFKVTEDENRYKLPHNCLKVISVNIDKQPVIIKSFEWMSQNKHYIDDDNFLVCMDEQSFLLYPLEMLKVGMNIELNYNFIEQIILKTDDIPVSLMSKNALLFYSMHLALQVNTSDKNRDRSTHYMKLYDKEISQLRQTYYKNRHSKRLRSKFIKV